MRSGPWLRGLVVLLAGCARATLPDQGYALLDTVDAATELIVDVRCPGAGGSVRYLYNDGSTEIEEVHRRAAADRFDAEHVLRLGERAERYFVHDDEGNCGLVAVIDHREQAISRFDPPLTTAWTAHAPGETKTTEARMAVFDLRNPRRRRDAGSVRQEVTYVADRRISTPLGTITARELEVRFTADLGLADVDQHARVFVADDHGVVLELEHRTVRVLGVMPSETAASLVLVGSE